jgi:hypothetical protein
VIRKGSLCEILMDFLIYFSYSATNVLVGKPEEKRPLGRPRRRCEDNIKMDLQEVGKGVVGTEWSWPRIRTGGGHLWVR